MTELLLLIQPTVIDSNRNLTDTNNQEQQNATIGKATLAEPTLPKEN